MGCTMSLGVVRKTHNAKNDYFRHPPLQMAVINFVWDFFLNLYRAKQNLDPSHPSLSVTNFTNNFLSKEKNLK